MYRFTLIFIVFSKLLCCRGQIHGKVISVADGDTFTILTKENQQVKIRLHGVDCPEKSQDYGSVAKQFTAYLLFGKMSEVIPSDTDRYGRIIGIVPIGNTSLNEMLLQHGLAWHYCKYDKNEQWHSLQDSARAAGAGMWQKNDVIPPWEYRKMK